MSTPKMFLHEITYLLLVTFTLIIYTQQQVKDPAVVEALNKYQLQCAKEVGLELDYVKKNWNDNRFPNDDKLKCFFKCLLLNLGIMDAKGEVIDDVLRKVTAAFNDVATDREIVTECGAINGADLCETAYKLAACVRHAELEK